MGLINSALHIGRSAITSYQSALSVVGNNIANAADPDYTRQRAVLNPVQGAPLPQGVQPGAGVALTSLQRILNEALEERLRQALGTVQAAKVGSQILSQIEQSFNELSDNDVSSMLTTLFNSFQDVQNSPTDLALRSVTLGHAEALAGTLRAQRSSLLGLTDELNSQIVAAVEQADDLARQVAELNVKIVEAEAGGHTASSLHDARDALLRELSELVNITVRTQPGGSVSVFVGNETLVQLGTSRGLTTRQLVDDEWVRQQVYFADDSGEIAIGGGKLQGLMDARDNIIQDVVGQLDQLAAGLIAVLNEVHVNGQGLEGFTTLTASAAVGATDVPLNEAAAALPFTPQTGSFFITVTDDSSGQTVSHRIDVDLDGQDGNDTTLESLVDQINATVGNLTADIGLDNRLVLSAAPGFSFTFGHDGVSGRDDTANVLLALGVNNLFEGHDATDIAVNETLIAQPQFLAAAAVKMDGDGANAGLLTDAARQAHTLFDGASIFDFYNQAIAELGMRTAAGQALEESTRGVLASLQQQRDSISGVNLDEEAVELLRYEKAFQGSARFTSVIDRLISELLAIAR